MVFNKSFLQIWQSCTKLFAALMLANALFMVHALMVYAQSDALYLTTDNLNFRTGPSTDAQRIKIVSSGTKVNVLEIGLDGWYKVVLNDQEGYMSGDFLIKEAEYTSNVPGGVELVQWEEAKNIFSIGVPAQVYDVWSGRTYYVKSFSNGNHADVEPVTTDDTAIMKQTYNGRWSWDCRPVIVTINGRSMAASINGMPHGGGVNSSNGMSGQVCIHFQGSKTHNGNRSHEADHQRCVLAAYNWSN